MHTACVHTAIDLHAMQKMSVSVKRSKNTDALVDRHECRSARRSKQPYMKLLTVQNACCRKSCFNNARKDTEIRMIRSNYYKLHTSNQSFPIVVHQQRPKRDTDSRTSRLSTHRTDRTQLSLQHQCNVCFQLQKA